METWHKSWNRVRFAIFGRIGSRLRITYLRIQGARIGEGTHLSRVLITWPHQLVIGRKCLVEQNVFFKFDGPWRKGPSILIGNRAFIGSGCEFNIRERIEIGEDALISSGCRFIDHDHGMRAGTSMNAQADESKPISIGNDVWLGVNAVVLKGVTIGIGAVVGAGAVVTTDIPAGEIFAGVPAKKIGSRLARR